MNSVLTDTFTGCLQLLEILEFENPPANPGNLLEFKWSSWKFLSNDRKFYFMVNGFTT